MRPRKVNVPHQGAPAALQGSRASRARRGVVACAWVAFFMVITGRPAAAEELRLRIAWGGGQAAAWRGEIRVSEGQLKRAQSLGVEVDAPGSLLANGNQIAITSPRPRAYEAVDVTVVADLSATLHVRLARADNLQRPYVAKIPLVQLVSQAHNESLDGDGNRLLIRRAPGDELRVNVVRDHLVFAPGESWKVDIEPHLPQLPSGAAARLQLQLRAAHNRPVLWSDQRTLEPQAAGRLSIVAQWAIPVPTEEGVYDLRVVLTELRGPNPFKSRPKQVERTVQFVVIDPHGPRPEELQTDWRELISFNASQPRWWERLTRLPAWNRLPVTSPRTLSQGDAQPWSYQDELVSRLEPGKWQAFPLPISESDRPHRLEIDCPANDLQTLGLAIVEPEIGSGMTVPTAQTALHVQPQAGASGGLQMHSILFWPRSRLPYVVLTNLRDDAPALFGQIRVLEGPVRLPADPARPPVRGFRQAYARVDRAPFWETFAGPRARDAQSGRGLTDWQTFYDSARRWAQHLRHAGYTGAILPSLCEGSTLYPAVHLDPSPRFDTGRYFNNGQDPVSKDILEMLFRLFDREGLRLVTELQFVSPLPELEQAIKRKMRPGIELVDAQGRKWRSLDPKSRDGSYYNPLDPQVQEAMADVVKDVVLRYAHHESFGGVALQLSPRTYTHLPDFSWGYDATTIGRFLQDAGQAKPSPLQPGRETIRELQEGPLREQWQTWRAAQLTQLYRRGAGELQQIRPDLRLLLTGASLVDAAALRETLQPTLNRRADVRGALLAMGLDTEQLGAVKGLAFLRPQPRAPHPPLVQQGHRWELANMAEVDRLFAPASRHAVEFHIAAIKYSLPFLKTLQGGKVEDGLTTTQVPGLPAGAAGRQRFVESVVRQDSRLFVDGAPTAVLGDTEALRPLLDTFRRLPDQPFEEVSLDEDGLPPQVVFRKLAIRDRTYVYAVNHAPWPVSVEVQLDGPAAMHLTDLSEGRAAGQLEREDSHWVWRFSLAPYDLTAGMLNAENVEVRVVDTQPPEHVRADLRAVLSELVGRAAQLKDPQGWRQLVNPGFEMPGQLGLAGWETARGEDLTVAADQGFRRSGFGSLKLQSRGPVAWARSDPFPSPQTGRLSVHVWLRGEVDNQRPFRVALEGRVGNRPYYRYAVVGGQGDGTFGNREWVPYVLHLDDLPTEGLQELRVRFDLMGPGTVWVDDVQLYDRSFTRAEQNELSKIIALADLQLREGRLAACAATLQGYWPRYLLQYVRRGQRRMADIPPPPLPGGPPTEQDEKRAGLIDRLKQLVPPVPRR